jgi:Tfp pilus assembly protein PilV
MVRVHESMSAGFTMLEALLGIAVASIIALASAGLFKAGIMTYNYTARQNDILENARKALSGDASKRGLLWAARTAPTVQALNANTLVVADVGGVTSTTFSLTSQNLNYTNASGTFKLADKITAISFAYYNIGPDGRIQVSTAATSATLVTASLTLTGKNASQREYKAFSGARLRNHL